MTVGLTGGIGSGKTTVAKMLSAFKIPVYTADTEAKKLMTLSTSIRKKITEKFGKKAYLNDQLNTQYLSDIVFKDHLQLQALNAIVHPEVEKHFRKWRQQQSDNPYVVIESALLFESGQADLCDYTLTVTAPLEERIKRVITRDTTTVKAVKQRVKNQWSQAKKISMSDYVIENMDLKTTEKQLKKIHEILVNKSTTDNPR